MRGGVWVLSLFAAVWAGAALIGIGAPSWTLALPVAVAGAILFAASRLRRRGPAVSGEERRRMGRAVGVWSAVEGVAIAVAANALIRTGHADQIPPAIAALVGLHFIPLARPLGFRLYYVVAAVLLALAAAGAALPTTFRLPVVGFGAAAILWITAMALARHPSGSAGG